MAGGAQARDQISIVGSSTVFPFATAAAEQSSHATSFPAPVVESTGTGGIGERHPDITGVSRAMKASEYKT